jgi:hypothetical protein
MLHLHPAKQITFLEKLALELREEEKIYFSKNFSKLLPSKKELLVLHPLTKRHRTPLIKNSIVR